MLRRCSRSVPRSPRPRRSSSDRVPARANRIARRGWPESFSTPGPGGGAGRRRLRVPSTPWALRGSLREVQRHAQPVFPVGPVEVRAVSPAEGDGEPHSSGAVHFDRAGIRSLGADPPGDQPSSAFEELDRAAGVTPVETPVLPGEDGLVPFQPVLDDARAPPRPGPQSAACSRAAGTRGASRPRPTRIFARPVSRGPAPARAPAEAPRRSWSRSRPFPPSGNPGPKGVRSSRPGDAPERSAGVYGRFSGTRSPYSR